MSRRTGSQGFHHDRALVLTYPTRLTNLTLLVAAMGRIWAVVTSWTRTQVVTRGHRSSAGGIQDKASATACAPLRMSLTESLV